MIILHPACQWRLTLFELCCLAGLHGYTLSNRRSRSGRSYLILTRA